MRKTCINMGLNIKNSNIITPSTKKNFIVYLKFRFTWNSDSQGGRGVRTERCWRAGPSGQGHSPSWQPLFFLASILRLARWHACLSWTALAKHRLIPTIYFIISGLCKHRHPHDCTVILTLPSFISTHCQNVFQVPSLQINCLLISF